MRSGRAVVAQPGRLGPQAGGRRPTAGARSERDLLPGRQRHQVAPSAASSTALKTTGRWSRPHEDRSDGHGHALDGDGHAVRWPWPGGGHGIGWPRPRGGGHASGGHGHAAATRLDGHGHTVRWQWPRGGGHTVRWPRCWQREIAGYSARGGPSRPHRRAAAEQFVNAAWSIKSK
jgi:hypothetical protein